MFGIRQDIVGPAPTEKNPRAQAIRPVLYVSFTVPREGKIVAFAEMPIEKPEVGGKAAEVNGVTN